MSEQVNTVKVFKDQDSTKVLKDAVTTFGVFSSDVLELSKSVDKPDDFYVDGQSITFNISLKNTGSRRVNDFVVKDELVNIVLPVNENQYVVTTTVGNITQASNPVIVSDISLSPGEEAFITITGVIGEK